LLPGFEGDPIDSWRDLVFGTTNGDNGDETDNDGDEWNVLAEYALGLNPRMRDTPEIRPEIVLRPDGRQHLGIRYRRMLSAIDVHYIIECSRDLAEWHDAGGISETVESEINIDGTVEVMVCLKEALENGEFPFLRVRIERAK